MHIFPPGGVPTKISYHGMRDINVSADGIEVPDEIASVFIISHDFLTQAPVAAAAAAQPPQKPLHPVEIMTRDELVASCKSLDIAVDATASDDELRLLVLDHLTGPETPSV